MVEKELKYVVSADTTGWQSQMAKINSQLANVNKVVSKNFGQIAKASKEVGTAMLGMSAAILGSVAISVKKFAELGDQLMDTSAKTGIGVERLSEYKYMAEITDSSLDGLTNGIKFMQNNLVSASEGTGTAVGALKKLNLEIGDLMGMSPDKQFDTLATAIASLPDPAQRTATAIDIFGRSATELLPLFAKGAAGMEELRQKAHELGITMTEETAAKGDELKAALDNLKISSDGLRIAIGEGVAPVIEEFADKLTDAVEKVTEFIKQNPELVQTLTKVAVGVAGVGGALVLVGTVGPQILRAVGYLKTAVTLLSTVNPYLTAAAAAVTVLAIGTEKLVEAQQKQIDNSETITKGLQEYCKILQGEVGDIDAVKAAIKALESEGNLGLWDKVYRGTTEGKSPYETLIGGAYDLTDAQKKVLEILKASLPELEKQAVVNTNIAKSITAEEEATEKFIASLSKLTDEADYANSVAGKLGISFEDFQKYLISIGREADLTAGNFAKWGASTDAWAYGLGINLVTVADTLALTTEKMIQDIADWTNEAKNKAKEVTQAQIDAIDKQLQAEGEAHQERLDNLQEEYNAQAKAIDDKLALTLDGYQFQIDSIDAQQEQEDRAAKEADNRQKIASLQSQIANEIDAGKRAELQNELKDLLTDIERDRIRQSREDQKDALRVEMEEARKAAEAAKEQAQKDYDQKVTQENYDFQRFTDNLNIKKALLETALQEQLKRYDDDQENFETYLNDKLRATTDYVNAYNSLMAKLTKESENGSGTGSTWLIPAPTIPGSSSVPASTIGPNLLPPPTIPHAAEGMIFAAPTLAMVGENYNPEAVIPLDRLNEVMASINPRGGGMGNSPIIINVSGSVVSERELVQSIRDALYDIQRHNVTTGLV